MQICSFSQSFSYLHLAVKKYKNVQLFIYYWLNKVKYLKEMIKLSNINVFSNSQARRRNVKECMVTGNITCEVREACKCKDTSILNKLWIRSRLSHHSLYNRWTCLVFSLFLFILELLFQEYANMCHFFGALTGYLRKMLFNY